MSRLSGGVTGFARGPHILRVPGCAKANVTSGVASLANELSREETIHLTTAANNLKSRGLSPQCPLINLGKQLRALSAQDQCMDLLLVMHAC